MLEAVKDERYLVRFMGDLERYTVLDEAFLVSFSEFYSLETAERRRRPQKVHAVDLGLRNAVGVTGAPDRGRLAESAVWNAISLQSHDGLFYWQGKGEVDIAVRQANQIRGLVQVAYDLEDDRVRRREIGALEEARGVFPEAETMLVVGQGSEGNDEAGAPDIEIVPLWRFLVERAEPTGNR